MANLPRQRERIKRTNGFLAFFPTRPASADGTTPGAIVAFARVVRAIHDSYDSNQIRVD